MKGERRKKKKKKNKKKQNKTKQNKKKPHETIMLVNIVTILVFFQIQINPTNHPVCWYHYIKCESIQLFYINQQSNNT
jgi:predicted histidine transporter YuiF (NhaC family)